MAHPDLNLLVTLDVLLTEGSVAAAARRLRLSPSAMSRALARLREATGDPLLVRAGRGLVPTPRALELKADASRLVREVEAVLRPLEAIDPATLQRTFAIRVRDGFVENFGAALIARAAREAPGVRLCFVAKSDKDSGPLRDGTVDLETGVLGKDMGPELRAQALFRDRFIGVVRDGHPLAGAPVTPALYAAADHVLVARRALKQGAIDTAFAGQGLVRKVAVVVGTFSEALALVRTSDLVASVPERHTAYLRQGLHDFPLPLGQVDFTLSLFWHPRMEADPGHRWLRNCVREVCLSMVPGKL
ncbi:LysR family transcriptional regulator [Zavarzinia sp.]|uniref:LysR family transcriptional regulator n=1 Tax=Zavarzinia sp. TaxID=2027920 RepID=UPI00356AC752